MQTAHARFPCSLTSRGSRFPTDKVLNGLINQLLLPPCRLHFLFHSVLRQIAGTVGILKYFFKYCIYLFLERGERRKKEGNINTSISCLSHAPHWGPGPQPRPVP